MSRGIKKPRFLEENGAFSKFELQADVIRGQSSSNSRVIRFFIPLKNFIFLCSTQSASADGHAGSRNFRYKILCSRFRNYYYRPIEIVSGIV